MSDISFTLSLRNARAQQIVNALGSGAYFKLYTGTKPAVAGEPTASTVLAQLAMSTVAGVIANGILTFNTVSNDISADASGICNWGRMLTSDGVPVIDFTCGSTSSLAVLKMDNTLFNQGDTIGITSFVISEGNT